MRTASFKAALVAAFACIAISIVAVPAGATTHPHNAAGFVTDGSRQDDVAHCVGPNPGYFACLVAIYPQLPKYLNELWNASHPQVQTAAINTPTQATPFGPRNGTERCIFQVENKRDYGRSLNPSHFGAFQFSRDLWANNGGGNDWGSASPAEQWQVFYNTVAHDRNYSNWLPYENGQCWLGMP
jgi:hypothetical protein